MIYMVLSTKGITLTLFQVLLHHNSKPDSYTLVFSLSVPGLPYM